MSRHLYPIVEEKKLDSHFRMDILQSPQTEHGQKRTFDSFPNLLVSNNNKKLK